MIVGVVIVVVGFGVLNYKGFIKIIEVFLILLVLVFVVGYIVYMIIKLMFKNYNLMKMNKCFWCV